MIIEKAKVVAVDGSYAYVQAHRRSACDSCSVNKGCGTSVLSKVVGQRFTRLRVLNTPQAKIGDSVTIGVEETGLLNSAMLVYILPLILIVLFGVLGRVVLGAQFTEAWAILFGVFGLIVSLGGIKFFAQYMSSRPDYSPVVLEIDSSDFA